MKLIFLLLPLTVCCISPALAAKIGKVKVAGVDVSGLTETEARRRLTRELSPRLNHQHILTDGKTTVQRPRKYLGMSLNVDGMVKRALSNKEPFVPLMIKVNWLGLQSSLRRVAPAFAVQGKPARVGEWKGKVIIVPETDWRRLDAPKSAWTLVPKIEKDPGVKYLKLQVISSKPDLTAARLKGINGVLGRYQTSFNAGNVKRTNNMRIGIKAIDGTLLSPGEVFSLNDTVGERTQARGYRTTIIFKNGYRVPGIGGGISQVTGTIFNAALLAGLEIVTYRTHSQPVDYIPLGRDATVAWGSFDMKFKNNTGAPVYIKYTLQGDRANAVIFGKKANQKVDLNVTSAKLGEREIKAKLFRTIRRDGKVVSKHQVGNSHYKWNVGDWYD